MYEIIRGMQILLYHIRNINNFYWLEQRKVYVLHVHIIPIDLCKNVIKSFNISTDY